MPQITAIKVNKKRPNRRSIFIDGQFAFTVSEGIFFQHNLEEGGELSDKQIKELTTAEEFDKAKQAAVNLLSYRPRSIKEVSNRLVQKGWDLDLADRVTEELVDKGYLNDEEFAAMFARDRAKNKCLGPVAIKSELIKAGVAQKLIEQTIETVYSKYPADELIQRLMKKRGIDLDVPLEKQEKQRFINLLKRKGFTWDQMESVVRNLSVKTAN
ncbi:MAG: RecX family transcriptional regulator [Candidatus Marinimicrobia bacterium]|nr:RecX family transcriptional regulator [Candidatus Neomarinimicrobiota bacterium]MDP6578205.1 RecX family transcriptional regulator [Candidatus Neomarinimicrobiota bacterium]MDP7060797.1 RecX family transcriptional regulator [Candidatus Neomarinimicrobiota bacterium]